MKSAYLKLHISVFLSGLTGMFGKLISMNECFIIFYRMWFAFLIMFGYLFFVKKLPHDDLKNAVKPLTLGALLGIHLILFFASIKYANVSVGVVCYSLVGLFTALFEPLIEKTEFSVQELLISFMAVIGIVLIFSIDVKFRLGIILGILSAAVFALYSIGNKLVRKNSRSMLFYELLGGSLVVTAIIPFYFAAYPIASFVPSVKDLAYLLILAFLCTDLLYILHIQALKVLSAFTVSLTGNLEPIYGILIAMIFFGEANDLNLAFYCGLVLILLSVFLQTMKSKNSY